jgi:hypothetical protein
VVWRQAEIALSKLALHNKLLCHMKCLRWEGAVFPVDVVEQILQTVRDLEQATIVVKQISGWRVEQEPAIKAPGSMAVG